MSHINNGYNSEHFVSDQLNNLECKCSHKNIHYDIDCILPNGKYRKIEVKSCRYLTYSKQFKRVFGRFDFKYKRNWDKMIKENIWLVFVIYINNEYEIIGVVNPKKLEYKRWITISEIMSSRKVLSWQSYLNKLRLIKK